MRVSRDLRHGLAVSVASYIAFAGGYAFQVLTGRSLGPTEYSVVGASGSVFNAVVVILGALELASAQALASAPSDALRKHDATASAWRMAVVVSSGGICLALVIAALFSFQSFHVGSPWPIITLAFGMPLVGAATWRRAVDRSANQFASIAWRIIAEKGISMLALVVALMLRTGATGVIAAMAIGSFAWVAGPTRPRPVRVARRVSWTAMLEQLRQNSPASRIIPVLLTLGIVGNVDVLVVQSRYRPDLAGQYAVVALFGRILFLGIMTLVGVLVPKVAASSDPRAAFLLLLQYFGTGLVAALGAITLALIAGPQFVALMFGAAYRPSSLVLGLQIAFAALVGLQGLISAYAQSRSVPLALRGHLMTMGLILVLLFVSRDVTTMLALTIAGQIAALIASAAWTTAHERLHFSAGAAGLLVPAAVDETPALT